MKTVSWVIRHKDTKIFIIEIFNSKLIPLLKEEYEAVPKLEQLQELYRKVKEDNEKAKINNLPTG